jgi:hypothetical protein
MDQLGMSSATETAKGASGVMTIGAWPDVVLRIVTRDFDAGSNIRPDNV